MRTVLSVLGRVLPIALIAAAGCSGGSTPPASGGPVPTATATPTATPASSPTPARSAQPQVVYVNFNYAKTTSTYGTLAYYAATSTAPAAQAISEVAGSRIVFDNTDTAEHTASGLGTSGFPSSFDNSAGTTASGATIDAGTTWSSGALGAGAISGAFTVGPPGTYYFGCYYHYSFGMQDVIDSTS